MQISSGHITGMSLSRSRSYAGEKQTLPSECPTLSSPPVIHSPFTCPENTRWANPSYSLLFAPSRRSILFFYCFSGRHNAVIGWHIVACLSPRFLLITLLPWHFAKLLSKGQNSREEHVQLIRYEHLSLFPTGGDNFVRKKIVRHSQPRVYRAIDEIRTRSYIRLKLRFRNI